MELKNTEKQEHSVVALTIEITKAEFEAAKDKAFKKSGKNITVPGFRKGKAPRKMIEKLYGEGVFFEEAFNILYPQAMDMAVEKSGIKMVGRADVDLGEPAEEGGLTIIAKVPVEPEVELGEYKGIEAEKETVKVLQADVKAELNRMAQRFARTETVERKAKKNDTVDIDFEGFVDGVAFEGGKAEHHELTLGSGAFIPGFEDQLIGHKAGETVDVKVTFPENYGAKDLAGKEALFVTTIKAVKEKQVPAADDEFASEVSEFDTLDEYKKDLKKTLKEQKEKAATTTNEKNVIAKVVENASVEIPAPMLEAQLDNMLYDYQTRLAQQGIPMDQYLKITGQTVEQIKDQMKESAEKNLKTSLVIEAIMEKENITVADERVDEEFKKIAEQYKMEYDDLMKTVSEEQKESMKREVAFQETIDMLVAEANLVKAEKKSKKAAEDEEKTEE